MDGSMETTSKESGDGGECKVRKRGCRRNEEHDNALWMNDKIEWNRKMAPWKQNQRGVVMVENTEREAM